MVLAVSPEGIMQQFCVSHKNFQNEMNSFQKQSRFLNPTKVPFLENLFERFHQKVGKLKNHEI